LTVVTNDLRATYIAKPVVDDLCPFTSPTAAAPDRILKEGEARHRTVRVLRVYSVQRIRVISLAAKTRLDFYRLQSSRQCPADTTTADVRFRRKVIIRLSVFVKR